MVEPRNFGIDLTQIFWNDLNKEQLNLTLPADKKLVEPLKSLSIDNEYFTYKLASSDKENKIVITRELVFKKDYVSKEKVAEFNKLLKQVIESDYQQLAIK